MKIVQAAMAGTLESSDLMVKVSPVESRAGCGHPERSV